MSLKTTERRRRKETEAADEWGDGDYYDDNDDSDGDGRKVITDPHFHGGTTAPASTATPAPTTPSSCGSWASASCQSAET